MLQDYTTYQVLQAFFDYPRMPFHVRKLSRMLHLGPISVINHLKKLLKEKLITINKEWIYPTYQANRENEKFKLLKKQNIILRLYQSDLPTYLEETLRPSCIVLFGSAARGEDTEQSDIDLFIQAPGASLDLSKHEKMLHRKINILFEHDLKSLSNELLNNIINGNILSGYLKVL